MIVTDDNLLIDFELVFKAIREEKGDWKKVEKRIVRVFGVGAGGVIKPTRSLLAGVIY